MDDKIKMMMPENATMTRVDSQTLGYVSMVFEQHPLEGGPVPIVKRITRETTVGDLVDWYYQIFPHNKYVYDLRIIEET